MCRKHKKNYSTAAAGTRIADAKGLPTGSKVRVLDPSTGSGQAWTTTLTGYDPHKRPVWTASNNTYLSTTDFVEIKLNYIGWAEETKNIHQKTGQTDLVVVEKFTYDHAGKVLTQTHQINSAPAQRIADNIYDQLGQLKKKNVGGTTLQAALQDVDYAYNIRGWLKTINDVNNIGTIDLFAFKLGYNEGTSPLYNGNISLTQWKTRNTDSSLKTYNYTYDALNRITSAINTNANYNLDLVNYDKNGNIMALKRKGHTNATATTFGMMDDLTYNYDAGNKLTKVEDIASLEGFKNGANIPIEYTYDQNGNMLTDANKGITGIVYNHLNLPTQVTMAGQNILYIYDAVGTKLRKTVSGITTDYAGNYVYENSVLQFFNTAEGYVEPNGTGWEYVYNFLDHLGSVRLSYTDANGDGTVATSEIIEENSYYPFGLKMKGFNNAVSSLGNSVAKRYKYNGKELNDELGLEWYDFGARNYDAALGRWMNLDPLAEEYAPLSPYSYAANNPIRFVDYDGENFGVEIDHEKKTIKFSANFYFSNNNALNDNKAVIQAFNDFSGTFTNSDGETYSISFDVKGSVVEPDSEAEKVAKEDTIGNFVTEVSEDSAFEGLYKKEGGTENPKDVGGFTKNQKEIFNKNSVANQQTREHEFAHTFGLDENEGGVMDYKEDFKSMTNLNKSNITKIISLTLRNIKKIKGGEKIQRGIPLRRFKEIGTYNGGKGFFKTGFLTNGIKIK